jgi:hypothetical protein
MYFIASAEVLCYALFSGCSQLGTHQFDALTPFSRPEELRRVIDKHTYSTTALEEATLYGCAE